MTVTNWIFLVFLGLTIVAALANKIFPSQCGDDWMGEACMLACLLFTVIFGFLSFVQWL